MAHSINHKSRQLKDVELHDTTDTSLDEKDRDTHALSFDHDMSIDKENPITIDQYKSQYDDQPFRLGNTYAFCWIQGRPLFVLGPHWPFFVCFSSTIFTIGFIYFYYLWDIIHPVVRNVGLVIFVFQTISYAYTSLINPGIPHKKSLIGKNGEIQLKDFRICEFCSLIMNMDIDTTHCEDCNICIEGHDHHCPWTSKCVGKRNLWSFYGFVIGTLCLFGFFIFALIFIANKK